MILKYPRVACIEIYDLEGTNTQRHLSSFLKLTLDHGSHDSTDWGTQHLDVIRWSAELKILHQFNNGRLHFSQSNGVKLASHLDKENWE